VGLVSGCGMGSGGRVLRPSRLLRELESWLLEGLWFLNAESLAYLTS
jgi:hypothetical protein